MTFAGKNILAVDTGLTGCKALVFNPIGNVIAEAQRTTPVESNGKGRSVIDMDVLWRVACEAISEAVGCSGDIGCIGFSGHGNGLYCIDAVGNSVGKAVSSMDCCAESELNLLNESERERLRELSLQQLWAGQPGMILRRLKHECPDDYSRIHKILFCKDYLAFRLTGIPVTDYSDVSASGLLNNTIGKYDPEITGLLGIKEASEMLPEIICGYDIRGVVSGQGAHDTGLPEGIPVIGGMFDVDACAYGCGTVVPGDACSIAGTWNINAVVSGHMNYSDRIRQCIRRTDGQTALLIDSSATSAVNIKWYAGKLLGCDKSSDFEKLDAGLEHYEYTFRSPYYLPFVNGSLGCGMSRGAFVGLDISCDRETLFAAVYEGICFAHRWHFDNLVATDSEISTMTLTGGAAKGKEFRQLMADICGINVQTVNIEQSGAFGIWAAASCALKRFNDIGEAVAGKIRITDTRQPDEIRHAVFEERYMKFKELIKCPL